MGTIKNMRNIAKEISRSTVIDVQDAFQGRGESVIEKFGTGWTNSVDPETMQELKAYWRALDIDGNYTLFNVFCRVLKIDASKSPVVGLFSLPPKKWLSK